VCLVLFSLVSAAFLANKAVYKTKKKAIEQSGVRKGSPMEGVGSMAGRI